MHAKTVLSPTPVRTRPEPCITGEALFQMGTIGPCELIDGRIVPMVPPGGVHGELEARVTFALTSFVRQHRCGRVLAGEVGIYTQRNPDRVRGADVAFISNERLTGKLPVGYLHMAPDLVVEIVSPFDRWTDIQEKVGEYVALGVQRVWVVDPRVVDPRQRVVLVYRSVTEVETYAENALLLGEGALQGFAVTVASLFEDEWTNE